MSLYQVLASAEVVGSAVPSQSLSMLSHSSVAPGLIASALSLQSPVTEAKPLGRSQ